jgi:small subunit ribosomal protein S2
MSESLVKQLLEAGVHFGHKSSNWNPKMSPYIFTKRNGIRIIDMRETIKGLLLAKKFLTRVVAENKEVLFVGTKRQAREIIEQKASDSGAAYVTERWLGGTLTNFQTIRSRLKRLDELEELMNSPEWDNYSKKMGAQLWRERRKIERNLSGIRGLDSLPGAMVVIDVRRELNALREAKKLGIPTVCLIDTDSDPDLADIPIPGNDDAIRATELVIDQLMGAVAEGKTARAQAELEKKGGEESGEQQRRRSSRAQFRADEAPQEEGTQPGAEPATPAGEPQRQTSGSEAPHVTENVQRDQQPSVVPPEQQEKDAEERPAPPSEEQAQEPVRTGRGQQQTHAGAQSPSGSESTG